MASDPRLVCPKCSDSRLIRIEHVIQGGKAYKSCYCSGCDHQWMTAETGKDVPTRVSDSHNPDRPDRSR